MATLPYLLWLTGREGLRPETAAALLRRFGTAEAVYFADEKEFELLQLPGQAVPLPGGQVPWPGRSTSWPTATGWASSW